MIQSINFSEFCDAFHACDRNENFSYEGKRILFDFLEEWEEETGQPVELDVIALCCEYSEMTWQEVAEAYSIDLSDCDPEDEDENKDFVMEYLQENTLYCGETPAGSLVFADF